MENEVKLENIPDKNIFDGLENAVGTMREFGSFAAMIMDDYSVCIKAASGWMVVYPPATETWALLVCLIIEWDEAAKRSVDNYIKMLVFPTANILAALDEEFARDIADALGRLAERIAAAKTETEKDEDYEDEDVDSQGL